MPSLFFSLTWVVSIIFNKMKCLEILRLTWLIVNFKLIVGVLFQGFLGHSMLIISVINKAALNL